MSGPPCRPFWPGDESLTEGVPPRVGLYRLFHAIWQCGAEHYDEVAGEPAGKSPENRLQRPVRLQAGGPASDRGRGLQPGRSRLHHR